MYTVTRPRPAWQLLGLIREKGIRNLVIRVEPECVAVKAKGLRRWYRLPWKKIWVLAVMAEADSIRRAKADARKAKREGRGR